MMPKLNGIETCEKLKLRHGDNCIILFLSARNEEFTQIAAYDAGAHAILLTKPVKPKILIKKILAILKNKTTYNNNYKNEIRVDKPKHQVYVNMMKNQINQSSLNLKFYFYYLLIRYCFK